jgi:hypothetical protein
MLVFGFVVIVTVVLSDQPIDDGCENSVFTLNGLLFLVGLVASLFLTLGKGALMNSGGRVHSNRRSKAAHLSTFRVSKDQAICTGIVMYGYIK